ncbi:hypothetical protein J8A87_06910 [Vibrio parahaemolyticus]|uniref:hypothetical protein n=1 Tax=Vibrio parahaemolyticus TaxID=670 RepID=UPI0004D8856B|nr:hypothetical protein [Vibrio parahaemolyticus]EJG1272416.1 hypothetical protein [Vibrio parahaemolyticus]MCF9164199.1 hypothetical protein [Vibrio parahaemolyticus]MCF9177698.1 hypothetical protein [Vibrio parahaemolyticus]MCF9184060.1 hypothetical protein [Vibrio parahaemolyticus]OMC59419.1 hypothetical protein CFSAN001595_0216705 [Vibrio parahaemolyticus CFSAN001595]
MKNLVKWIVTLLLVIAALVSHQLGYVSEGVVNLMLVAAWLNAALLICMFFVLFDDKKLNDFADRIRTSGLKPWQSKLQSTLVTLIGCTFIYFGYWITGAVWLIAALIASVVTYALHKMASVER